MKKAEQKVSWSGAKQQQLLLSLQVKLPEFMTIKDFAAAIKKTRLKLLKN